MNADVINIEMHKRTGRHFGYLSGMRTFLCLLLFACGCGGDGLDTRVRVINASDKDLFFYYFLGYLDGDTAIPYCDYYRFVASGDTTRVAVHGDWNDAYLNAPGGTVNWFFFALETIDTATCDEIKADYLVLQRYDLTLDSMYRNDWTIVFE